MIVGTTIALSNQPLQFIGKNVILKMNKKSCSRKVDAVHEVLELVMEKKTYEPVSILINYAGKLNECVVQIVFPFS